MYIAFQLNHKHYPGAASEYRYPFCVKAYLYNARFPYQSILHTELSTSTNRFKNYRRLRKDRRKKQTQSGYLSMTPIHINRTYIIPGDRN